MAWQQRASSGTASGWAARATVAAASASASTYLGPLKQNNPSLLACFRVRPKTLSLLPASTNPAGGSTFCKKKNKNKNQQAAARNIIASPSV
jgi:hypothetical protein